MTRELAEDGYAGVEVRVVPLRTEIIIRATRTQNVLGEKGQRIRELTTVIQKRYVCMWLWGVGRWMDGWRRDDDGVIDHDDDDGVND